ncbi:hypothetical protein K7432_010546 [Basidiobolus ranarum]|uniref:Uncharacterized protein n=1 Tax=Basidiobolus ranarum TaxID=34480 RepID=A0ABR2VVC4_9FUNG
MLFKITIYLPTILYYSSATSSLNEDYTYLVNSSFTDISVDLGNDKDQPRDCCLFLGIICENNRVAQLVFMGNITGKLPNDLGKLDYLSGITFVDTKVTGLIPSSISNLRRLKYLQVKIKILEVLFYCRFWNN